MTTWNIQSSVKGQEATWCGKDRGQALIWSKQVTAKISAMAEA